METDGTTAQTSTLKCATLNLKSDESANAAHRLLPCQRTAEHL
jgi:hypothetical protein